MNHPERAFSFAEIERREDLLDAMFNHRWPLCYSFYHDKLLYLNDGESEDLPEYAVVSVDKTEGRFGVHGREIGRINPSRLQKADAMKLVQEMKTGSCAGESSVRLVAEPKWHHRCRLCDLDEE
ncbi:MAG: hypothetical protein HPY61_01815 [Methanotrichaceae archaeon]|nr:hypothetical protein [Methanotrichaceae archaeon]